MVGKCCNMVLHALSYQLILIVMMMNSTFKLANGQTFLEVAYKKQTHMWPKSPIYPGGKVVVDGILSPYHVDLSCAHTHTKPQNKPWWKVDLGGDYAVRNVKILNRAGCECYTRLSNFTVVVGFDNITLSNNELCHYQASAVGSGAWLNATCPQLIVGRFVIIQIIGPSEFRGQQMLTLCEVQVFAAAYPFTQHSRMKGKRTMIANGQRIKEHELRTSFPVRSVGECAHSCWTSDKRLCVSFAVCSHQGVKWCYVGATYNGTQFTEPDPECDVYKLTYIID